MSVTIKSRFLQILSILFALSHSQTFLIDQCNCVDGNFDLVVDPIESPSDTVLMVLDESEQSFSCNQNDIGVTKDLTDDSNALITLLTTSENILTPDIFVIAFEEEVIDNEEFILFEALMNENVAATLSFSKDNDVQIFTYRQAELNISSTESSIKTVIFGDRFDEDTNGTIAFVCVLNESPNGLTCSESQPEESFIVDPTVPITLLRGGNSQEGTITLKLFASFANTLEEVEQILRQNIKENDMFQPLPIVSDSAADKIIEIDEDSVFLMNSLQIFEQDIDNLAFSLVGSEEPFISPELDFVGLRNFEATYFNEFFDKCVLRVQFSVDYLAVEDIPEGRSFEESLLEGDEIKLDLEVASSVDFESGVLEEGTVTFTLPDNGNFLTRDIDDFCDDDIGEPGEDVELSLSNGNLNLCFTSRSPGLVVVNFTITTAGNLTTFSILEVDVEEDTFVVFEYVAIFGTIGLTLLVVLVLPQGERIDTRLSRDDKFEGEEDIKAEKEEEAAVAEAEAEESASVDDVIVATM